MNLKDEFNKSNGISSKIIRYITMLLFLAALSGAALNSGCSGKRDSALSLAGEPVLISGPATNFRYSTSAIPTMNLKPLFDESCARCHNAEITPDVPLTNYLEIYTRGVLIKRAVQPGGRMQKYAPYDFEMIMHWYDAGMPE